MELHCQQLKALPYKQFRPEELLMKYHDFSASANSSRKRQSHLSGKRNDKRRKQSKRTWSREFICLADMHQEHIPTLNEHAILQTAGLGWKKLSFPVDGSAADVHGAILEAFPALVDTGYKLLRAGDSGSKRLNVIQTPTEGFSVGFLKAILNQAKCYLRPIQGDLAVDVSSEVSLSLFSGLSFLRIVNLETKRLP